MIEWMKKIEQLQKFDKSFVVVTLVNVVGSAPQEVGAKMIVTNDGLSWGTVGGGKLEAQAIVRAKEFLENCSNSALQTWNLQRDIGMTCGGEVGLFFEVYQRRPWPLAIFGAGHVSQEVCRIVQTWPCRVTVFDTRAEWLERLPGAENLERKLSENMAAEVSSLPDNSTLLCMTMGHSTDIPVLQQALRQPDRFSMIGVIGSKLKSLKVMQELESLGAPRETLSELVCPLGLPVGNNTPQEIAISICSQLLAIRDNKSFSVDKGYVFKDG